MKKEKEIQDQKERESGESTCLVRCRLESRIEPDNEHKGVDTARLQHALDATNAAHRRCHATTKQANKIKKQT